MSRASRSPLKFNVRADLFSETAAINRFDDLVAEWIPRLVFTSSALAIGYGIFRSGAFLPSLPPGLK